MKIKIYVLTSILALIIGCKVPEGTTGLKIDKNEKGLLPAILKMNTELNMTPSFSIKTIDSTISWNPKTFHFIELDCDFMKELFSKNILVLSFTTKSDNSVVSGLDNAKREGIYFIDLESEKVLFIKFENEITLPAYASWLSPHSNRKGILDVNFDTNTLLLIDGSKNEYTYELTEIKKPFPITCSI
ncbi:MAG: hypothetical protein ACI9Y7_000392 [Dokdonia sp.]|jgi:hypothetical protein